MRESDSDVVRTLATQLNLGGLYAEEVCTRAGVEKETPIDDVTDDQLRALHEALERIGERLRSGDVDPRVYEEELSDDEAEDRDPRRRRRHAFPLSEHEGLPSVGFDSFNAAVDEYFYRLDRDGSEEGEAPADASPSRPDFEEEIGKQERIVEQQQGAIEGFEEQAEAERERAELLYAEYDLVDEVLSTVQEAREAEVPWDEIAETLDAGAEQGIPAAETVVDVDGGEGTVTVELRGGDGEDDDGETIGSSSTRVRAWRSTPTASIRKPSASKGRKRARWRRLSRLARSWRPSKSGKPSGRRRRRLPTRPPGTEPTTGKKRRTAGVPDRLALPLLDPDPEPRRLVRPLPVVLHFDGLPRHRRTQRRPERGSLSRSTWANTTGSSTRRRTGGPGDAPEGRGALESADPVDFSEETLREVAQFAVSYSSDWKDGRGAGDAYMVEPDQVSKTPESGEYIEKGSFVIRGDRTYFEDVPCRIAVGVQCEPVTQAIGGPPSAIVDRVATSVTLEPGMYAQNDAAMMVYRELKGRFADQSFVRKVASADQLQEFIPAGGSDIVD